MIDVKTPESPGWWLQRLSRKIEVRNRERLTQLAAYYDGNPPLPGVPDTARKAIKEFHRKSRLNLAELAVEATRERMTPTGIRTGVQADDTGDAEAWSWWQSAGMDVKVADVLEGMLKLGDGYMIVGLGGDGPVITAEDARQVVTAHDPLDQRRVVAALKMFHDPVAELDLAYVYLPGRLRVAKRARRRLGTGPVRFSASGWEWDEDRSADLPTGLEDFMPVVRFRNRSGVGEFERHIDLLDRINHMVLQRLVIATMQAFKQRAIEGDLDDVYPDDHPQAGQPIDWDEVFEAGPDALWRLPSGVKIWESGQADMVGILSAVKDDLRDFAAVTRTPMAMFNPDSANQTAEGATAAREGFVFKIEDRIMRAKDGLIDVLALAFRLAFDAERARRDRLGILWAPVERRSLAERADAASKAGNDMPAEARLTEIWQIPPAVAKRYAEELAAERALAASQAALGLSAMSGFGPEPAGADVG